MSNLIDDNLPLFLNLEEPIAVYVVNNTLLGCTLYYGKNHLPYRTLNLLFELFSHQEFRKHVPQIFHKHFVDKSKLAINPIHDCIIGDLEDQKNTYCLNFSIQIEPGKKLPVLIYDIIYMNKKLRLDFSLTFNDAFYTLANICANAVCNWIWELPEREVTTMFSNLFKHPKVIKSERYYGRNMGTAIKFTVNYLSYLNDELLSGSILPDTILRLGGVHILALLAELKPVSKFIRTIFNELDTIEKLSLNKQLMYYTLLKFLPKKSTVPDIYQSYIKKNPKILETLRQRLQKEFPVSNFEI